MTPNTLRAFAVRLAVLFFATMFVVLAGACGDDNDDSSSDTTQPAGTATVAGTAAVGTPVSGKITVFAASSLTEAFKGLDQGFQAANPAATIEFNFAGSPALVTQLDQGATADVLATADEKNMNNALQMELVVDGGTAFAKNRLVIIVPKDNPGGIATPADLAKPGLRFVLALAEVPVGNYARQSLAKYDGTAGYATDFSETSFRNIVSEEPNVKAVVTKVQLGEADAGIVYVTDVTKDVSADVKTIDIPDAYNVIATYPIAVTKDAGSPDVAQAFIDYVLSEAGQATLAKYGFLPAK